MTEIDFRTQITRLSESFGQRGFTTQRLDMIYENIGNVSVNAFKQAVDHIIRTFPVAKVPTPDDIIMAVRGCNKTEFWFEEKGEQISCKRCDDFGYLMVTFKEKKMAAYCQCRAGIEKREENSSRQNIQHWLDNYERLGYKAQKFEQKWFMIDGPALLENKKFENKVDAWRYFLKKSDDLWAEILKEKNI